MIRVPKNVIVGAIFIGLAALFGFSSLSLNLGTAGRMGPGYFPLMLSIALAVLGLAVLVIGFMRMEEMPRAANLRGITLVAAAVAAFALGVRPLGLVPTVFVCSLLFSLTGRDFRPLSSTVAALVLALGSWALFVMGLRMPWAAFGYLFM